MPACGPEALQRSSRRHSTVTQPPTTGLVLILKGTTDLLFPLHPPNLHSSRRSTHPCAAPPAACKMADGRGEGARTAPCGGARAVCCRRGGQRHPRSPAAALDAGARCAPGRARPGEAAAKARPPRPALPRRRGGRPGGEGPAPAAGFPAPGAASGGRAEPGRAAPRRGAPHPVPHRPPAPAGIPPPPPPRTGKCERGPSAALGRRRWGSRHPSGRRRAAARLPRPGPCCTGPFVSRPGPSLQGCAGPPSRTSGPWGAGPSPGGLRAALAPPSSPRGV